MRIIVLFVVLALVLTACSQVEPEPPIEVNEEEKVPVGIESKDSEPVEAPPEEEINETLEEEHVISCEEWAKELFPEQWVFKQDVTNDPKYDKNPLTLREGKWTDDLTIAGTSSTKVMKGSETGENINDYYTRPIFVTITNYGYSYSKQIIDDEGTIMGESSFKIRPVFRVIHDTVKDEENSYGDTIQIRYLSLVLKEPNFISCDRAE